jgi:hypothetical protein
VESKEEEQREGSIYLISRLVGERGGRVKSKTERGFTLYFYRLTGERDGRVKGKTESVHTISYPGIGYGESCESEEEEQREDFLHTSTD